MTVPSSSYLLVDLHSEQDVAVGVAVVDLQHRPVLRLLLRAVVDVLDLFPRQLLQLKSAQRTVAVETGQPAVARRLQDHNQDVGRVVGVVDLQDRLGDGREAAAALHGQRSEGHHSGRLEKRRGKKIRI